MVVVHLFLNWLTFKSQLKIDLLFLNRPTHTTFFAVNDLLIDQLIIKTRLVDKLPTEPAIRISADLFFSVSNFFFYQLSMIEEIDPLRGCAEDSN